MSVESRDEVSQERDYATWHAKKDSERLWQMTVKMHKVDCMSNVNKVMELVARKAYQNIKMGSFEMLAMLPQLQSNEYPRKPSGCKRKYASNGFLSWSE